MGQCTVFWLLYFCPSQKAQTQTCPYTHRHTDSIHLENNHNIKKCLEPMLTVSRVNNYRLIISNDSVALTWRKGQGYCTLSIRAARLHWSVAALLKLSNTRAAPFTCNYLFYICCILLHSKAPFLNVLHWQPWWVENTECKQATSNVTAWRRQLRHH